MQKLRVIIFYFLLLSLNSLTINSLKCYQCGSGVLTGKDCPNPFSAANFDDSVKCTRESNSIKPGTEPFCAVSLTFLLLKLTRQGLSI